MSSFQELELDVIRWAEARKIIPRSTPFAQATKTAEESIELVEAAARMKLLNEIMLDMPDIEDRLYGYMKKANDDFMDAVGDTVVTLINACALADVGINECLAKALKVIQERKGTLMPNGVFVKEQP
jgi:hypothetical protein